MLNFARLQQNPACIATGGWEQKSGQELNRSTLGVIRLGSIGKMVVCLALALGMKVIAYDPYNDQTFIEETGVRLLSLDEVLVSSDFVRLHIFLDESTQHLVNSDSLKRMEYLINTARGEVVDEDALAEALENNALSGVALDVVETEPLSADSRLRQFTNVVVTAHIGAATVEARSRSSLMAAHQIIDMLGGVTRTNLVKPGYMHATSSEEVVH